MIGRLKDMVRDREGNWIISIVTKDRMDGDRFDELAKYDCDIEIKKHRNIRSRTANAYFHVLVNKIARETGESDEECKIRLVTSYGTLARTDDGKYLLFILPISADARHFYKYAVAFDKRTVNGVTCTCWKVYKDTHMMDTKEFSQVIDGAVQEARELGIETDTPKQIEEMKKKWAEYETAHGY